MFQRVVLCETPTNSTSPVTSTRSQPSGLPRGRENRCAKCGGLMQTGFILDRSHGSNFQEEWVQGRPRSFLYRVILRGARRQKVLTYRCAECGYLESYARVAACPKCGCDLVGTVRGACPQCGMAVLSGGLAASPRVSLETTMRQAEILNWFWRVVRLVMACLPSSLIP